MTYFGFFVQTDASLCHWTKPTADFISTTGKIQRFFGRFGVKILRENELPRSSPEFPGLSPDFPRRFAGLPELHRIFLKTVVFFKITRTFCIWMDFVVFSMVWASFWRIAILWPNTRPNAHLRADLRCGASVRILSANGGGLVPSGHIGLGRLVFARCTWSNCLKTWRTWDRPMVIAAIACVSEACGVCHRYVGLWGDSKWVWEDLVNPVSVYGKQNDSLNNSHMHSVENQKAWLC